MKKTRPSPRECLGRNLKFIKDLAGLSDVQVSQRAGNDAVGKVKVSPKTVNNMYNKRTDVQLSKLDAVAEVFSVSSWHLLMPDISKEYENLADFDRLYDCWAAATEEGRKHILMVAEREAKYNDEK